MFLILNLAGLLAQDFTENTLKKLPIYTLKEALSINYEEVYRLNLRKSNLSQLPEEVYLFKNLRYLDVSNNKLTEIPSNLSGLNQLEYLDFSSNALTTLPHEINQLKSLKVLLLNHNEIVTLPTGIGELTNLKELHLWGTLMVTFPSSILLLKDTLKKIDLRYVPMSKMEHKRWRRLLKKTNITYSIQCNCDI